MEITAEVTVKRTKPNAHLWRVYIDGVWVGLGTREECDEFADELREDADKAAFVRDLLREDS